MAKVPFSKLQAVVNTNIVKANHINKSGENVEYEIKSYLPFSEKLDLISNVVNQSIDENGFYNPMKIQMFMTLEIIYAYTNLNFTEKMKEDPFKLYDILISSGIYSTVMNILGDEFIELKNFIFSTVESIYKYKNSVLGILDAVSADYSNLNLDASEIQQKLADPENMNLLRDVLNKLG